MSQVAHPEDHIALSWQTPSGGSGYRRISPCSTAGSNVGSNLITSGSGGGGSQAWPGVGAEPPLIIMTDELTVRFVSAAGAGAGAAGGAGAGSGGEEDDTLRARDSTGMRRAWGFRLTARGREVRALTDGRESCRTRTYDRIVRCWCPRLWLLTGICLGMATADSLCSTSRVDNARSLLQPPPARPARVQTLPGV